MTDVITDPSRCFVAFPSAASELAKAAVLLDETWTPDQFALGSKAVYLWCAGGILESKLVKAFERLMRDRVTARNWATVLKLHAMSR